MTTIHASCIDELTAALGADRVQTGDDIRRLHGTDSSFHPPALPDAVVFPETVDECLEIVRTCIRHETPMVPFGAGSSLEGHIMALRGGVSIDMTRMNAITRISVEDLDVTVQAGVTRRQLDARLRPEGVFFSVDPGADATLGGMIATGASGTTTVRYGAMRENVLSLLVVTPDGELVADPLARPQVLRRLDLTRLFIGAEGTLGAHRRGDAARPSDARGDVAAVLFRGDGGRRLHRDRGRAVRHPGGAHGAARRRLTIDMINKHFEFDMPVTPTLFLEFHGAEAEVASQAESVREIAQEHGLQGYEAAADEAERRRLWRARTGPTRRRRRRSRAARSSRPTCACPCPSWRRACSRRRRTSPSTA